MMMMSILTSASLLPAAFYSYIPHLSPSCSFLRYLTIPLSPHQVQQRFYEHSAASVVIYAGVPELVLGGNAYSRLQQHLQSNDHQSVPGNNQGNRLLMQGGDLRERRERWEEKASMSDLVAADNTETNIELLSIAMDMKNEANDTSRGTSVHIQDMKNDSSGRQEDPRLMLLQACLANSPETKEVDSLSYSMWGHGLYDHPQLALPQAVGDSKCQCGNVHCTCTECDCGSYCNCTTTAPSLHPKSLSHALSTSTAISDDYDVYEDNTKQSVPRNEKGAEGLFSHGTLTILQLGIVCPRKNQHFTALVTLLLYILLVEVSHSKDPHTVSTSGEQLDDVDSHQNINRSSRNKHEKKPLRKGQRQLNHNNHGGPARGHPPILTIL